MKKNVRILMTIVIPLALIAVFAILLMLFALRIHSKQEETLQNTLTDAAQEQKIGLAMRISGRFTALDHERVLAEAREAVEGLRARAHWPT